MPVTIRWHAFVSSSHYRTCWTGHEVSLICLDNWLRWFYSGKNGAGEPSCQSSSLFATVGAGLMMHTRGHSAASEQLFYFPHWQISHTQFCSIYFVDFVCVTIKLLTEITTKTHWIVVMCCPQPERTWWMEQQPMLIIYWGVRTGRNCLSFTLDVFELRQQLRLRLIFIRLYNVVDFLFLGAAFTVKYHRDASTWTLFSQTIKLILLQIWTLSDIVTSLTSFTAAPTCQKLLQITCWLLLWTEGLFAVISQQ